MAKKKVYKVQEPTNRGIHVYYKSNSLDDCWQYYIKLLAAGKCSDACGVIG